MLAFWWLRAPEAPESRQLAQQQRQARSTEVPLIALLSEELPPTPPPTPLPPTATPQPTPTPTPGLTRHKVVAGESVSAIAARYGANPQEIIQANGLSADGRLNVGQELIIPLAGPSGGPGPTPTATGGALMYVVKSGDTISDIAQRYGSRIDWIMAANKLNPADYLRVGQALLIPLMPITPTPTATVAVTPQTPTPTPEPTLAAPILLSPPDGSVLAGQSEVMLNWLAVGTLAADEWYVVTLLAGDNRRPAAIWWTKATTWRLPGELRGASRAGVDFTWRVQVRKGSPDQPGPAASPSSAERRFTWR
ncbi:MAG: LysM peptidoglycan-binding domain-containing protein [Anaerolineae bacterium]